MRVAVLAALFATFFPGGLPPGVTNLDPVTLALLNLPGSKCPNFGDQFCIPSVQPDLSINANGSVGRLVKTGLGTFDDDQWVLSTDHQLTTNNKLTFRFFHDNSALFQPFNGGSTLPFARTTPGRNRFAKLGLTTVISPRIVNEVRLGYNQFFFGLVPDELIKLGDIGQITQRLSNFFWKPSSRMRKRGSLTIRWHGSIGRPTRLLRRDVRSDAPFS